MSQIFSFQFKNKIIFISVIFVAPKRVGQQIFLPSFLAVVGSGMDKNQDPGSGINIPDPQH
jgi:hypothetical protein